MFIFQYLGWALGWILWGAFFIFKNFGLAIIVFTIIIKPMLFPFSVKQQKSMAGTAKLSKKQKELQEKYGNNRQLLQEEMNKLYEKEGVKPMGGCLTTIIPMLVLFGIFYAVAYPLTNTLHLNGTSVQNAIDYVQTIPGYFSNTNAAYQQISLLNLFQNEQFVNTGAIQSFFTGDELSKIQMFSHGFKIFGNVDLFAVPSNQPGFWSWYLLFPVFCFLSNVGSSFIMQRMNKNNAMAQQQGCMKWLIYLLPLFSAYIAYSVPAAMSFYWIISALISLVQSIVLAKIFSPDQITAKSEARHAALMFETESRIPYEYVPVERYSAPAEETKSGKKPASKKKKK